jgi:hypothetical protein
MSYVTINAIKIKPLENLTLTQHWVTTLSTTSVESTSTTSINKQHSKLNSNFNPINTTGGDLDGK